MIPRWGSAPGLTGWLTVNRNVKKKKKSFVSPVRSVCVDGTWAREAEESPLLETVTRKRLVKILHAGENLACSDL
jgi:hypothetical protein